jgi:FkbM family methyltransferase
VLVRDLHGHAFLVPQIGAPLGFELLIHGVYEPLELSLVLNWLRPGAVFVDVGANIGCYTLPAADIVGSAGRVIAIEASPRVLPYLDQNLAMNDARNVEIVRRAVGEREGTTVFHEHRATASAWARSHPNSTPNPSASRCQPSTRRSVDSESAMLTW